MKLKLDHLLLILNCCTWLLILVINLFPSSVLRIILGVPFLLFIPGYTLLAALLPKKEGISGIERIALSLGLSIAIVPLIGFTVNYTPWGIRLEPIMYSVASFILMCSVVAWFRQKRLIENELLTIDFFVTIPRWGEGVRDKILTVVLVLVILGVLAITGYFIAAPKEGETFSEFYLLGQQGETTNYPTELKLGDTGIMVVGIFNHEGKDTSYRVGVVINGNRSHDVGPFLLADEESLEVKVLFVPDMVGEDQKIEFFLYTDDGSESTLESLYIWIDVVEQ